MTAMHDGIDPAAKLITFLAAGILVATTPGWQAWNLAAFGVMTVVLLIGFKAPMGEIGRAHV